MVTKSRFGIRLALLLCPIAASAQVHTKQVLVGYKCMMLAQQWSGEGPTPPPVFAVGTAVAGRPPHRSTRAAFPHVAPTLDD
jgi:hypothetical protein